MLFTRDETTNVGVELNVYKGRGVRFREKKNRWYGYCYIFILNQTVDTEKIDLGEHDDENSALDHLSSVI